MLAVGTVPVAATSIALGQRNRLVVVLALASTLLLLAALTLRYEFSEMDVARLDGHARNFALAALLVGLGAPAPGLVAALALHRGCANHRHNCVADGNRASTERASSGSFSRTRAVQLPTNGARNLGSLTVILRQTL